jgi:hypothetical protein
MIVLTLVLLVGVLFARYVPFCGANSGGQQAAGGAVTTVFTAAVPTTELAAVEISEPKPKTKRKKDKSVLQFREVEVPTAVTVSVVMPAAAVPIVDHRQAAHARSLQVATIASSARL